VRISGVRLFALWLVQKEGVTHQGAQRNIYKYDDTRFMCIPSLVFCSSSKEDCSIFDTCSIQMAFQNSNVTQQWGHTVDDPNAKTNYAIDTTWMVPFEYNAPNKSVFLFKAGNRNFTLDESIKNGSTSEASLRRKFA
jgi:hypothetical protein